MSAIHLAEIPTLDALFRERAIRTPGQVSHADFVPKTNQRREFTWEQMYAEIGRWQTALKKENLEPGDRVAIMLRNSIEWVLFDQAAMGLGLVTVPLYVVDRPENVAYILGDSGARILLLETPEQWNQLAALPDAVPGLSRVVMVRPGEKPIADRRVVAMDDWLPATGNTPQHLNNDGHQLASIVYTSGTTGKPKGVMLTHKNMLANVEGSLKYIDVHDGDEILSFLPLSHTFERTAGYYLVVATGVKTTYARSVQVLADDLLNEKPTVLIAVPRIFELILAKIKTQLLSRPALEQKIFDFTVETGWSRFEWQQKRGPWKPSFLLWPLLDKLVAAKVRDRFGGRLRFAVSGGAALPPQAAKWFIALGIPILQGYGLTESSPVIAANTLEDNLPSSVGRALPNVQTRLGLGDELQVKGPSVMQGYWKHADATKAIFTDDGWLKTGDVVNIDSGGHITITGRAKDIIVLSNGEKVPPGDMEMSIMRDRVFEQVMVIGEGKAFLAMIGVLNRDEWKRVAEEAHLNPDELENSAAEKLILRRVAAQIKSFPGYAQIRRGIFSFEPWSIDNGLMTPTLKIRRPQVVASRAQQIHSIYDDR